MTYEQYLEEYSKTDDLEQCPVCFTYSTEQGICEDCQATQSVVFGLTCSPEIECDTDCENCKHFNDNKP